MEEDSIMAEYKPIPQNSIKVYLEIWSCGSECCGMAYFNIWSQQKDNPYRNKLWSSYSVSYEDLSKEELEELRQEVIDAANHYGIILSDINEDCIWDWEGSNEAK